MNNWIIVGIIVGLLLIGGVAFVSAISSDNIDSTKTTASCTSCGGKCGAEKNCGLATCGAVNGGSCNCGR
ncbi:hypothetical protein M0R19_02195 [Candidatus Pacearchaeota archaeon]|nr:hypothetical protein [Candidatus Pacearchaeota archaeon]